MQPIQTTVLWAVTFSYWLYGIGCARQVWLERPLVGRSSGGVAVARRRIGGRL
ncbi:MAG TPA: hypothetical protein VIX41_11150 [Acidimicrobiales bacterium]